MDKWTLHCLHNDVTINEESGTIKKYIYEMGIAYMSYSPDVAYNGMSMSNSVVLILIRQYN